MSIGNFWNNFTHGFMHGMFNSNPFFGCGFNNWGCFGGFMPFGCGYNTMPTSLFLVPNVMNFSFYPMMPESMPPTFNVFSMNQDPAEMFPDELWQVSSTQNYLNNNNSNIFADINWGDSFIKFPDSSPTLPRQATLSEQPSVKDEKITYDATELKNTWSKKKSGLSDAFYNKVIQIAKNVNCSPNDLMALMYSESRLNTTAVNKKTKATGLIQFMPDTAKGLGTSQEALKTMSAEEQLKYVEKYLLNAKKSKGFGNSYIDAGTLYALTYVPKMAKNEVIATKSNDTNGWYSQNKGLDTNKDGKITKSELGERLKNYYA